MKFYDNSLTRKYELTEIILCGNFLGCSWFPLSTQKFENQFTFHIRLKWIIDFDVQYKILLLFNILL